LAACAPPRYTGTTCHSGADCPGSAAACLSSLGGVDAPGGYCSTSSCNVDDDCGSSGAYCDSDGNCLQQCNQRDQCQTRNANNRCFYTSAVGACLPSALSQCDPTKSDCACVRVGYDDVGRCFPTCDLPNSCAGGQNCIWLNTTAARDALNGAVCAPPGVVAAAQICQHEEDCVAGYECDVSRASGKSQCLEVCKNGTTACAAGTCQNAFKQATFGAGSLGLCF
jgi:hypothetical protein